MIIFVVLLVALVIAFTFRMLHWLLQPLARRQTFWLRGSYLLMGVELLAWTGWLFWVIRLLIRDSTVYAYFTGGIAFLLFVVLTWFLLRDVVAGIIFKLQHNLKLNQSIRVGRDVLGETTGRLLRLGIATLVLESATGERIKIPYTKLINEAVARSEASDVIEPFDFSLQVPTSMSKDRWVTALRRQILLLPWALAKRMPVVQWQSENEQFHTFDLRVYTLNAAQAHQIENHLRHVYHTAISN